MKLYSCHLVSRLYYNNQDTVGWVTYPGLSKNGQEIDYPVVQTENNDDYLYKDFHGKDNKNGTIFLDYRCKESNSASGHQISILYGHNMRSGQMFAPLNTLLNGVWAARQAPIINYSTLYKKEQYKPSKIEKNHICRLTNVIFELVTPTGFEPMIPP